jgi:hypothetical protein
MSSIGVALAAALMSSMGVFHAGPHQYPYGNLTLLNGHSRRLEDMASLGSSSQNDSFYQFHYLLDPHVGPISTCQGLKGLSACRVGNFKVTNVWGDILSLRRFCKASTEA